MTMITALAPGLPPAAAAPIKAKPDVLPDDAFVAEVGEGEDFSAVEDAAGVMLLALAALPLSRLSMDSAEGAAVSVSTVGAAAPTPPTPLPSTTALPAPATLGEGEAAPADPAPRSAEAAVRLQMADEVAREGATDGTGDGEMDQIKNVAIQEITPRMAMTSPPPAALLPDPTPGALTLAPAPVPPSVTLFPTDPPASAARQVAEGISSAMAAPAGNDRIELVLRPEELGRVRFELRNEGDRLMVTLTADRPETMDLLRRHLPELMAELEQAGYGGANLDFGQAGTPRGQETAGAADADGAFTAPPDVPLPTLMPRPMGIGSLDLRL